MRKPKAPEANRARILQAAIDEFAARGFKGASMDAIAAHIYDSATNVAYYQQYITSLGTKYNRPVLITEFGASGSVPQQQAFLQTMIPFMNGLAHVSHYAWFMAAANFLVDADGSLNAIGAAYENAA